VTVLHAYSYLCDMNLIDWIFNPLNLCSIHFSPVLPPPNIGII
jgi:hypothetical protein